ADDDGLLPDIEVAKAPDQAHSVELAGLFLEPADEQHVAKRGQLLLFGEVGHRARSVVAGTALGGRRNGRFVGGYRHMAPQEKGRAAGAHLLRKLVSKGAATAHELRNRGTSLNSH